MVERAFDDPITIVYVEDDERLARFTMEYLAAHNITATWLSRGDEAVETVKRLRPNAVVLDLMVPGVTGREICRQLRNFFDVPILMVTALSEEADRVLGLEGGADDYILKPYAPRELVARIRAQVRRATGRSGPAPTKIRVGELTIDAHAMTAHLHGEPIFLTTQEFALLRLLAERPGRVLGREQLLELLHGTPDEAFDRSIDVQISRLRQKLKDNPRQPEWIKTVRGAGYFLNPEAK